MIRVKVDSVATLKLKSEALAFHCRCSETCKHGVTGAAEQRKRQSLVSDIFFSLSSSCGYSLVDTRQ